MQKKRTVIFNLLNDKTSGGSHIYNYTPYICVVSSMTDALKKCNEWVQQKTVSELVSPIVRGIEFYEPINAEKVDKLTSTYVHNTSYGPAPARNPKYEQTVYKIAAKAKFLYSVVLDLNIADLLKYTEISDSGITKADEWTICATKPIAVS